MRQVHHIPEFAFKLLIFTLYAELDLPYVRRQETRFLIETKPLCHRFRVTIDSVTKSFTYLERSGYIYNLTRECGRVRFYVNLPKYLTLSTRSDALSKYVAENRSEEARRG